MTGCSASRPRARPIRSPQRRPYGGRKILGVYFSGGFISKIVSSPARRRRAFSSKNDGFWVFPGNLGISGTCHLDAQAKVRFRVLLDISGVCNELKCEEMLEFGVIQEGEMEGDFFGLAATPPPP